MRAKQFIVEYKKDAVNFTADDIKELEGIRDLETLKDRAFALISKPSQRPMKPEKVQWFKGALERLTNPTAVIKLMYDLLLSGEGHGVVGSRYSTNPNTYRQRFNESVGDGEEANAVVAEVIKLIGEGHTEVSPDVITTKVSATLGRPFMLKDLVAANNASPELQHYIDSINPTKIKFSTDILTVKNEDPMKEKEQAQAGVANMAARAANRPRLGEGIDKRISKGDITKFHTKLDKLVHSTFGKRPEEMKEGWGRGTDRVTLPDEPALYWSGKGPLSDEYNELYAKLVPSQGPADTIEGEVLRAASKIVYRHYNDGDEFNEASFRQLEEFIGKVSSYDDLAHKATEFALNANGNYHPNHGWDSLDVMEYGPEEYDDEDDSAWYEEPEWDQDEDEDEELNEHGGQEGYEPWGSQDLKPGQKAIQGKPVKDTKKFTKGLAKDLGKQFSQEPKVKEGWESGPEERAPRERDPDYDYDQARQEKLDIEAEKEQAKRPQQKVYTLTGRGPNYEPNYKFPGEYDSQEAAVAARAKLMADPNTPNPRDIGISTHTRYLDEGRETPLRDLEDYDAKKKALQDIQSNPHTANDPELSIEVMRRLAGLERQRKELK